MHINLKYATLGSISPLPEIAHFLKYLQTPPQNVLPPGSVLLEKAAETQFARVSPDDPLHQVGPKILFGSHSLGFTST